MINLLKRNKILFVFIAIELYFLMRFSASEAFFWGWGTFWGASWIYGLIGRGPSGALRGIGSPRNVDAMNYSTLSGAMAERAFATDKNNSRRVMAARMNLPYLIMFLLNVLGYIVVWYLIYKI